MSALDTIGFDAAPGAGFTLDGRRHTCQRWLRIVPGRRLVANCGGGVIAKLFLGRGAARRAAREREQLLALAARGCAVPQLLGFGEVERGVWAVLMEEVVAEGEPSPEQLVVALAALHDAGFVHRDPHPGNFLLNNGRCVLIDAGAIRPANAGSAVGIENLGRLLADLNVLDATRLELLFDVYRRARRSDPASLARLRQAVEGSRQALADSRMRKSERNGREFCHVEGPRYRGHRMRNVALGDLPVDPQRAFESGELAKVGNTASVARVTVAGTAFALKRYQIKSPWHRLRQSVRTSRARRAWRAAQRLIQVGAAVPRPVLLLEARGPLAGTNWLVSEWRDGETLDAAVADMDAEALRISAAQLADTWRRLAALGLAHRDAKARNYLWDGERLWMLDLDSVAIDRGGWRADRARLLRSLAGCPEAVRTFERVLSEPP